MSFRDDEKKRHEAIKEILFSSKACEWGTYNHIPRPFCLADGYSAENLHGSFREDALEYFHRRGIPWHDGLADGQDRPLPSNHLCCSQSFCVNSLWPMVRDPDLLGNIFRPFLPQLAQPLPFFADMPLPDDSQPFLVFEWIGAKNYLNENNWGTRGANCTSADFAFRFRRDDGQIQLVLGEWKYTEEYGKTPPKPSRTLTTRKGIYREAFNRWKASYANLPAYDHLFVEPFYQLMRQTLLAQTMELARQHESGEMEADIVSVVHVSPSANRGLAENFKAARELARFGRTVGDAWKEIAPRDRFLPISTEALLTVIDQVTPERLRPWSDWMLKRYGWWLA